MKQSAESQGRLALGLCLLLVAFVLCRLLSFPYSPEDWTNLTHVGERSFFDCLLPFHPTAEGTEGYPYYRPLWYAWMKFASLAGLSGGLAHSMVLVAHLGVVFLIHRLARRFGLSTLKATVLAILVGLAPGTQGALCWLAAGNKAFVLFFLLLGSYFILTLKQKNRIFIFFPLLALPALGSSENSYMMCLLFPLAVCLRQDFRAEASPRRWLVPLAVMALALLFCRLHLAQLPQNQGGGSSKVEALLAFIETDFSGWAGAVSQSLGRFFVHGLGLGEDRPKTGIILLGMVALLGSYLATRERRSWGLLAALAFFLILNFPTSFLGNEAQRHNAYLPAVGACVVLANCLFLLRRALFFPAVLAVSTFFVFVDIGRQDEWARYLDHSQRIFESSKVALPTAPKDGKVVLLNVPFEYRAAFRLRLGPKAGILKWRDTLLLSSKTSYVPPKDVPLPAGILLEYDGTIIKRTSFEVFAAKRKLPDAWFLDELQAFPDRILRWGSILAADQDLDKIAWSITPEVSGVAAPAPTKRSLEVQAHGFGRDEKGKPYYFWEFGATSDASTWLVLAWSPVFAPSLENISPLFQLKTLPWAFKTRIWDLSERKRERKMEVRPVLGILPALLLPGGDQKLRVELTLR